MSAKRYYRFSYYASSSDSKKGHLLLHQLRDADAALELSDILTQLGYQYGGLLLNYPAVGSEPDRVVDESLIGPNDLLLITGRPPLDDQHIRPRKPIIVRSHTTLETKVFAILERYFHTCARSEVTLSRELAKRLPEAVRRYRDVQFNLYLDRAYLVSLDGRKPNGSSPYATIAYLICAPKTWPGGPGILCVFGMGGQETLLWSYFLRTRFSHLVGRSEFVMAEIVEKPFEQPKDHLSFADDWEVNILVDIPIDAPELGCT